MTTASSFHECTACRGRLEFFGTRGAYTYERCSACRSIQLYPLPTPDELTRAYENDYATANHYGSDPDLIFENGEPFFRAIARSLREAGVSSGPVLDVGCGWGGILRVLLDEGYQAHGVDFESASLDYCRQQGLPVEVMDLERLETDGRRYDAALLVTVFEHLVDHRARLEQVSRVLAPGGVLLVLIPTAGMFGAVANLVRRARGSREIPGVNGTFEPPWHTTIFSVDGFQKILEDTPFEVQRVTASPSGSGRGLKGLVQYTATALAVGGERLFGRNWPIVLNHIFVCRLRRPTSAYAKSAIKPLLRH